MDGKRALDEIKMAKFLQTATVVERRRFPPHPPTIQQNRVAQPYMIFSQFKTKLGKLDRI